MCAMSVVMTDMINTPPYDWLKATFVPDMERLIKEAKERDEAAGRKDCELDEKRQAIKEIAMQLGIEIAFL